MSDQVKTVAATTMTGLVNEIVADLTTNPPKGLTEARLKLTDLVAALRGSIEEKMAAVKIGVPDYQAILSEVSVRVEGVAAVVEAITDLSKAEATATAALERVFKKLNAARIAARVWAKLQPAAVVQGAGGQRGCADRADRRADCLSTVSPSMLSEN